MSRSLKKSVYGFIYLFIFLLICVGIYAVFLKPSPSCFDKIQNQGETNIDCGGPCVACARKEIESLRVVGTPKWFLSETGESAFVGSVVNPNSTYGAKTFEYTFRVFKKDGTLLKELQGKNGIAPSEEKHVFQSTRIKDIRTVTIGRVELILGNSDWKSIAEFIRPRLSSPKNVSTIVEGNIIRVEGFMQNEGIISGENVEVIAFLVDRSAFHDEFFAGATIFSIPGGNEGHFVVNFPADSTFPKRIDSTRTRVFVSTQ